MVSEPREAPVTDRVQPGRFYGAGLPYVGLEP